MTQSYTAAGILWIHRPVRQVRARQVVQTKKALLHGSHDSNTADPFRRRRNGHLRVEASRPFCMAKQFPPIVAHADGYLLRRTQYK